MENYNSLNPTPGLGISVRMCSYEAGDVEENLRRLARPKYDVNALFVLDITRRELRENNIVLSLCI